MALDILMKGTSLDWTENNQLYDELKAWGKRIDILTTGMAFKKEPQEFLLSLHKAWSGERGQPQIESMDVTGDDAISTNASRMLLKLTAKQ